MTALCLKDIADLVMIVSIREKASDKLDEALLHYKMAMEMMEKLGTHDQKESILTLKNFAICYRNKGNLGEAKKLLQRAELEISS